MMTRNKTVCLLAVAASLSLLLGCEEWADKSRYDAPEDHTISKKKARHLPGLNDPGINCVECHGTDLSGGVVGVSCFECHGREWTGTGASGDIHNVIRDGVRHGTGLYSPESSCSRCHGNDLRGGSVNVSCYQCHGPVWTAEGTEHTANRGGVLHAPGLTDPRDNCSRCHGSDLRGGSVGVSCYQCHGELWLTGSVNHSVNKDGARHAPGLDNPGANCTACHGSDLRGGTVGVSCFRCHGAEWEDEEDDDDD